MRPRPVGAPCLHHACTLTRDSFTLKLAQEIVTELVKSIESLRKGRKNSVKWHAYQSVLNAIIPADCKHPKLLSERLVVSYDKVKLVSKKKSLIDEADDWSIGHDVKQRSDAFAVQYAAYTCQ